MNILVPLLTQFIETVHSTNFDFLFIPNIQFNGLHFIASLLVCKVYRQKNIYERYWLESLLSCYMIRFGGSFLIAVILGQPASWLLTYVTPFSLFLAWWLTFCSPNDLYWKYLSENKVLFELVYFYDAISQGHAVSSWGMDKSLYSSFHNNSDLISNSMVLNIICGIVCSNGGGILSDIFGIYEEKSYCINRPPAFLSHGADGDAARIKLSKCFLLACIYYFIITSSCFDHIIWIPSDLIGRKYFGHMIICLFQILDLIRSRLAPTLHVPGVITSAVLNLLLIPRTIQSKNGASLEDNVETVENKTITTPLPSQRKSSRERRTPKKLD